MKARRYSFHGVGLEVASSNDAVGAAVDDRLRHFRSQDEGDADLRFELRVGARHTVEPPAGDWRPVYEPPSGRVSYFPGLDVLYIEHAGARVLCDVARGEVTCSVAAPAEVDVWLLSRPLFTLPLVELLKRRGLFSVHAAAAAVGDVAVLVPGDTGAGKSTLAVAMARGGLPLLADDMVFLSHADGRLRVHGFPDEADVSDETAAWFPELRALIGRRPAGWPKHRVRIEDAFGAAVADVCAPGSLLFAAPSASQHSALTPLSPDEALLALAPNVLLTAPGPAQAHLDALAALVAESRCYRLATGRDFDRVPRLVRELTSA